MCVRVCVCVYVCVFAAHFVKTSALFMCGRMCVCVYVCVFADHFVETAGPIHVWAYTSVYDIIYLYIYIIYKYTSALP